MGGPCLCVCGGGGGCVCLCVGVCVCLGVGGGADIANGWAMWREGGQCRGRGDISARVSHVYESHALFVGAFAAVLKLDGGPFAFHCTGLGHVHVQRVSGGKHRRGEGGGVEVGGGDGQDGRQMEAGVYFAC